MTTRRAFLAGAAAAVVAPAAVAAVPPAPPAPPAPIAIIGQPMKHGWLAKRLQWLIHDDFDDDGFAWNLAQNRASLPAVAADHIGPEPLKDGEVLKLRYLADYGSVQATVHPYDEEADDYPDITTDRPIPSDPRGDVVFMLDGDEYGSESLESALDGADPGTYTVHVYAFSDPIPHRWDAAAPDFIPLEPVELPPCAA